MPFLPTLLLKAYLLAAKRIWSPGNAQLIVTSYLNWDITILPD